MNLKKKIDFEEPTKGKNDIIENFWKLSKFCYANFDILLIGAYRSDESIRIYDDKCIIDTKHLRIINKKGISYIKKLNFSIECDSTVRLEMMTDEDLSGMIDDVEKLVHAAKQHVKSMYEINLKDKR